LNLRPNSRLSNLEKKKEKTKRGKIERKIKAGSQEVDQIVMIEESDKMIEKVIEDKIIQKVEDILLGKMPMYQSEEIKILEDATTMMMIKRAKAINLTTQTIKKILEKKDQIKRIILNTVIKIIVKIKEKLIKKMIM
jgi:hypothetical protein